MMCVVYSWWCVLTRHDVCGLQLMMCTDQTLCVWFTADDVNWPHMSVVYSWCVLTRHYVWGLQLMMCTDQTLCVVYSWWCVFPRHYVCGLQLMCTEQTLCVWFTDDAYWPGIMCAVYTRCVLTRYYVCGLQLMMCTDQLLCEWFTADLYWPVIMCVVYSWCVLTRQYVCGLQMCTDQALCVRFTSDDVYWPRHDVCGFSWWCVLTGNDCKNKYAVFSIACSLIFVWNGEASWWSTWVYSLYCVTVYHAGKI